MDGKIGIESNLHGGSLFWFTVKLKHPVMPISLKRCHTDRLANTKVLVVDDNATSGSALRYQLTDLQMPDDYACSAEKALQMLETAAITGLPYSLAILDMQMPEMDGLGLARAMQSNPIYSRTRKIMLTSPGLRLESRVMRDAGISECLFKPVKEARLFECLIRVMGEAASGSAEHSREVGARLAPSGSKSTK